MNRPTFSILIPTYNRSQLLSRALHSALNQTYTDFELLVIDDNSIDDTGPLVKSLADSRIRYFVNSKNEGVSYCRNRGILESRGHYISLLDDDDQFDPLFLEKTLQSMKNNSAVDFIWCSVRVYRHDHSSPSIIARHSAEEPDSVEFKRVIMGLGTGFGLTLKRSTFDKIGLFDESLRTCVDFDLFTRLLAAKCHCQFIPLPLVDVYIQPGERLTRPTARRARDLEYVSEKHRAFYVEEMLWGTVRELVLVAYYKAGEKKRARSILVSMLTERLVSPGLLVQVCLEEIANNQVRRLFEVLVRPLRSAYHLVRSKTRDE